jgi:arylsulfatase A-like enzyme
MNKLEQLNLTNDTIVIFTADQGSVCISKEGMEEYLVSSQAPYRLGKAWLFEGGLRVPLIVRWPGKQAKDSINDTVTFNTDLYPTILEMLGLPLNPEQHTEGVSITKAIRGERMRLDRSFIWKYNRRHDAYGYLPSAAIRRGDYKLIYWMQDEHMELYNVAQDIGEEHDLRAEDPQLTQELLQELLHTLQK